MDTVVGWEHGPATHGRARRGPGARAGPARPRRWTRPDDAPDVDELPGLRAQAEELTELLDLGFHHREVLGRLGTTISLGVLLSGPAGSGQVGAGPGGRRSGRVPAYTRCGRRRWPR